MQEMSMLVETQGTGAVWYRDTKLLIYGSDRTSSRPVHWCPANWYVWDAGRYSTGDDVRWWRSLFASVGPGTGRGVRAVSSLWGRLMKKLSPDELKLPKNRPVSYLMVIFWTSLYYRRERAALADSHPEKDVCSGPAAAPDGSGKSLVEVLDDAQLVSGQFRWSQCGENGEWGTLPKAFAKSSQAMQSSLPRRRASNRPIREADVEDGGQEMAGRRRHSWYFMPSGLGALLKVLRRRQETSRGVIMPRKGGGAGATGWTQPAGGSPTHPCLAA